MQVQDYQASQVRCFIQATLDCRNFPGFKQEHVWQVFTRVASSADLQVNCASDFEEMRGILSSGTPTALEI